MEKYIRVMADYSASGLWDHKGVMIELALDHSEVKLSTEILQRLYAWQRWHDRDNQDYLDESHRTKEFDTQIFSLEGLRIAQAIKTHLGNDWTIVYFDEEKYRATLVDRSVYEYEI